MLFLELKRSFNECRCEAYLSVSSRPLQIRSWLRVKVEGKKGRRLTSDVMPIHVAMEKPYPGIVGPEPDHSVPLRSKQPAIAFDRDFGKWFSITVVA